MRLRDRFLGFGTIPPRDGPTPYRIADRIIRGLTIPLALGAIFYALAYTTATVLIYGGTALLWLVFGGDVTVVETSGFRPTWGGAALFAATVAMVVGLNQLLAGWSAKERWALRTVRVGAPALAAAATVGGWSRWEGAAGTPTVEAVLLVVLAAGLGALAAASWVGGAARAFGPGG